jgi:hypothetical protein
LHLKVEPGSVALNLYFAREPSTSLSGVFVSFVFGALVSGVVVVNDPMAGAWMRGDATPAIAKERN